MNDGDDFTGEDFEFARGEIFFAQLNIVNTAADRLGNIFEQMSTARGFVTGKLGAIGDVVEEQNSVVGLQSSVFSHGQSSRLKTDD